MRISSTIKSNLSLYFKGGYSYTENYVLDCLDAIYMNLKIYDEDGNIKTAVPSDVRSLGMTFLRTVYIDEQGKPSIIYAIGRVGSPF